MPRKNTSTSSFGSPGRAGHDSSSFYSARLYGGQPQTEPRPYMENSLPADQLDRINRTSSEQMSDLPDASVHLMVTSPPYNVGKDYDADLTLEEYRAFLRRVWAETYRVLVPGGRACINVANLGRKPYIPLHSYLIADLLDIGFLMRGEIIWDKAASASSSTAWGSWQSASNPTLRDVHEYILVLSKSDFRRPKLDGRVDTISREQFLEFTKSVWTFAAESARKIGHPAPFPVELPYRLIQLYSYSDEVVLDPFMGSGQTALAALQAGRHYVGYENNQEYHELADRRIRERPPAREGKNLTSPSLGSVAIRVPSMDAMVAFYSEVFGAEFYEVDTFGQRSQFGEVAGVTLKLVPIREAPDFDGFPVHQLGFEVLDVEKVITRAEALGGRLIDEIVNRDGRILAALRDPDGNTIELSSAAPLPGSQGDET